MDFSWALSTWTELIGAVLLVAGLGARFVMFLPLALSGAGQSESPHRLTLLPALI